MSEWAGEGSMPSTKSLTDLVQRRAARGPDSAAAPLREDARPSYRSLVVASIHETAQGLYAADVMNKQIMRQFDEACLTPSRPSVLNRRDRLKSGVPMPLAGRADAPIVQRRCGPVQGSRSSPRFGPSASDERHAATNAFAVGRSSGGAAATIRCFP